MTLGVSGKVLGDFKTRNFTEDIMFLSLTYCKQHEVFYEKALKIVIYILRFFWLQHVRDISMLSSAKFSVVRTSNILLMVLRYKKASNSFYQFKQKHERIKNLIVIHLQLYIDFFSFFLIFLGLFLKSFRQLNYISKKMF